MSGLNGTRGRVQNCPVLVTWLGTDTVPPMMIAVRNIATPSQHAITQRVVYVCITCVFPSILVSKYQDDMSA